VLDRALSFSPGLAHELSLVFSTYPASLIALLLSSNAGAGTVGAAVTIDRSQRPVQINDRLLADHWPRAYVRNQKGVPIRRTANPRSQIEAGQERHRHAMGGHDRHGYVLIAECHDSAVPLRCVLRRASSWHRADW